MDLHKDSRIVMTLDAGGTNFVFTALQYGKEIVEPITLHSSADYLPRCLENLTNGFRAVRDKLHDRGESPSAISFAFPGPTDYPRGIVGDLFNLPAFRGGVALGPMLEEQFNIPVFMNNDGDLYAYGEAIAGYLPWINRQLEEYGSQKRYKNLVGFTIGTGFGCGIVHNGELFLGDNSAGAEVYQLSQRYSPDTKAEDSISTRAIRNSYAHLTNTPYQDAPTTEEIYRIGIGESKGDRDSALESFRRMGQALGDLLCNTLALVDGIAVIGGGVSGAQELFLPALLGETKGRFIDTKGVEIPRLDNSLYYADDPKQMKQFLKGDIREIAVPNSSRRVMYDPFRRVAFGFSQIGTSRAINLGAYYYALSRL